ncbi:MAG: hypothetical protein ACYC6G_14035 [Desulfobaccales bacterium]
MRIYQDENDLVFTETVRQEYAANNCIFSGGFVSGDNKPPEDTLYLKMEKDGAESSIFLLRPDEMQIIAWIATGTVWSHLMQLLTARKPGEVDERGC